MINAVGYAAKHSFSRLKRFEFQREDAKDEEVEIEVLFCGVCHSDIHQVENAWSNTVYPCLPGHEVVGRVTRAGSAVTKHRVGDLVGVSCMIDSCRQCSPCLAGDQNYCEGPNSWLATYNGPMVAKAMTPDGGNMHGKDNTFGGYSNVLMVREDFVLKIPDGLRPELAAPILCAGVTSYSPMKHWGVMAGSVVGVIGMGGLGHLAAKIAKAMGAEVTVFTTTREKLEEARRLGVKGVMENEKDALKALKMRFDFMISTIPEKHDINPFIACLKRDATIVVCGAVETMAGVNNMEVAIHRKTSTGSLIGNIADTQEILDFCAQHQIGPDVEVIPIYQINDVYDEVEKGEVRFRYVVEMASLKPGLEG